jgi:soluble lytic murein transglycosylase-like protein
MRDYLQSLAKPYDLPADFVNAAAQTESSFNPRKVHITRPIPPETGDSYQKAKIMD